MCRIFGFRSVIQSQVHKSLVSAENALQLQSRDHPDGWGVAYYIAESPHIVKSDTTAVEDKLFKRVSGVVSSETVVAHIRKATAGDVTIINTHPFQYGRWVFAHNGNIKNFASVRMELLNKIKPPLRRFILGDTDSEVLFYLILSHLESHIKLEDRYCPVDILAEVVQQSIDEITATAGDFVHEEKGESTDTYLTFLMTNGETMLAHQGGKHLYYSTYKTRCSERDTCPSFAPECEAATQTGMVNHLIFSSEPLSGENVWLKMDPGQMMGVDGEMKLRIF